MKPICIIGARGGSKGIPNKNIRTFAGRPLIAHTIEFALNSNVFSNVVVSTEDKVIAKIAKKYGAIVPFIRPKKLATDNASMTDVLLHAISKLHSLELEFDVLVNLDCTVPLLQKSDITGAISLLQQKKCDSVCLVYNQHHNPYYNMFEKNSKGFLKLSKKQKAKVNSRQNAPVVYQAIGIYAIDVKKFLKYKKLFMPKTLPYEIPLYHGIMIDTELEFQIAECIEKKIIKI